MKHWIRAFIVAAGALILTALGGCAGTLPNPVAETTAALQSKVNTIVVIYAENNSFDRFYGNFSGANGLPPESALIPQKDRDAVTVLSKLPPTWGGVTMPGTPADQVITEAQSANLPNAPFLLETAFVAGTGVALRHSTITRDLYHRFFENQMQINEGKNDMFAALTDAGGITMGYIDGSQMALYELAHKYLLADNFFQGAFGGSFLNHQYLICACVPEYPNADTATAKPTIAELDKDSAGNWTHNLTPAPDMPASALTGPPKWKLSGNLTPRNYFGDGTFRAVNTMQPPYQPSGNKPSTSDKTGLYADPNVSTTLPAQTQTTIADLLDSKGIGWAWYSGGWTQASEDRTQVYNSSVIYGTPTLNFQAHHQPFNYYKTMDPMSSAAYRKVHLKDYNDLIADAKAGRLPQVTFYKPVGPLSQHPGYSSVAAGDQHIAKVISLLQQSPQWDKMVIVVAYDENGGVWDHVAPPKGDLIGPGTRIPALIISPLAKAGTVDHTQYDTSSILRLITRRFSLPALPGLTVRDAALKANGTPPMGDLTNALNF